VYNKREKTFITQFYTAKFHLLEISPYTNKYILRSTVVAINKS